MKARKEKKMESEDKREEWTEIVSIPPRPGSTATKSSKGSKASPVSIPVQRMNFLFQYAHFALVHLKRPEIAMHTVILLKKLAQKATLRLSVVSPTKTPFQLLFITRTHSHARTQLQFWNRHWSIRRNICPRCSVPWVPGVSVTTRVKGNGKVHRLIRKCGICSFSQDIQLRKEEEESRVETLEGTERKKTVKNRKGRKRRKKSHMEHNEADDIEEEQPSRERNRVFQLYRQAPS
jgi:RNase P subunit RPR2